MRVRFGASSIFQENGSDLAQKDLAIAYRRMLSMMKRASNSVQQNVPLKEISIHPLRHYWLNRVVAL